ncbi:MAG: SRPBCC family protein [Syntrophobacterales bacterium]|jgi:hypothetical protein
MIRSRFPDLEISRLVKVSPEAVWDLLTDTYRWVEWGPSILEVQSSERYIRRGSRGRVRTAVGIWVPFVVTEFDPGCWWSWQVGGVRATGHRVEPQDGRVCRLIFTVPVYAAPYLVVCKMAMGRIVRILEG